ncbi:hypothetical protein AOC10_01615 [Polynucleobacter asymbioticus]|uniref:hypothetical protein n=1 Tax=Polynucleobacter asymbioticus TaxID=576611 RepID=UPI0008FB1FB8|nr:hypothetical protein [Polynucleobacter asymbioticus]APC05315.1 hypothetical protein AOC10_01615 [Polynucleobacter asymbioticus]
MAHDRLPKDRFRHFGNFLKRFDQHRSSYRIQAMEDYEFSIANTRFVASYGLIANCDIHAEVLQSSAVNLTYLAQINARLNTFPDIGRPISIYVCTDALPEFAKSVLPNIDRPFTLVSGDSDMPVNATALGDAIALITNHPDLKNWFAQNIDCEHAKLHALPIGLDLHSKWIEPTIWGGGMILPALQELELRTILSNSLPWAQREPMAYCDWVMALERGDRQECKDRIDPTICVYPQESIARSQAWARQAQYAFVASPAGAGTDCHRTWEALSLGCVPIVKRSEITSLFEHLPVIVVNDWSEVSKALLEAKYREMQHQTFDFSKLLMTYWKNQINGDDAKNAEAEILPRMTLNQFRQMLTA